MRDLYREVTERILQALELGTLPWVKPWASTPGANTPCNAVTNRPYSGVNTVLLWLALNRGWKSPRFLTFKQAKEAGGTVRAGEHGSKIIFVKKLIGVKDKREGADEDAKRNVGLMREYTVFNVEQCDNLPDRVVKGPAMRVRNPDTRDELADDFLKSTGAVIRYDQGIAAYYPGADYIGMPSFESFKGADKFYTTMFHELTHWTGPKSRCDRDLKSRFGDQRYAAEELVAELGAAFVCAEFAFDNTSHNASYIANWIRLLKGDPKAFFTAASAAQKAVDFLRGKALADVDEVQQAA